MNNATTLPAGGDPVSRIVADLLAEDMERYHAEIETALAPQADYLTDVERQMYTRGKKIRPVMMMLSARMLHGPGPLPDKVIKGAASLEMLHVATLIHDDIIDDALVRRGLPSVSASRGSHTALLVGDMQFVQALRGFVDAIEVDRDMGLVKLVLDTAFDICRGELDELDAPWCGDTAQMRAHYFRTIDRKTAVLFGLACEAGVTLAGGRTHQARRAGFFGRRFGRAFQVMDDILDIVQSAATAGKTPGTDLVQGRWSLPLIHAVEVLGPDHAVARAMIDRVPPAPAALARCLGDIKASTAIDASYAEARDAALESLFYLQPFPASPYREALEDLAMYVVDRPIDSPPPAPSASPS